MDPAGASGPFRAGIDPGTLCRMRSRLFGRLEESARLAASLDGAAASAGSTLLVSGPPGVGKTTLLSATADVAQQRGFRVSRAAGVRSEAALPFSVAADLLRPLLGEAGHGLDDAQREAIGHALGLGPIDRESGIYAAYVASLQLASTAAEERPLLVMVDDWQWVDAASQGLLAFLARRVTAERIAIVLAARDTPDGWPDIPEADRLPLDGLDRDACDRMLEQHGLRVAPDVIRHLVEITTGNPLVLLETVRTLSPGQRHGEGPLPDAPILAPQLRQAWEERVAGLPEETRRALVILAAWHDVDADTYEASLRAAGIDPDAVVPAVDDGLVVASRSGYDFFHPLVETFVLDSTTATTRREVFQLLARCAAPEASAWYLAAATTGPSEDVATMLEATASHARARNGFAEASEALRRAAQLTADPEHRARRWLAAAGDAMVAGRLDQVVRSCDQALRDATAPALRGRLWHLRGQSDMWRGDVLDARRTMLRAADEFEAVEPDRARMMLAEATLPTVMAAHIPDAVALVEECLARTGDGALPADARVLLAQALLTAGRVDVAEEQLDLALSRLDDPDPVALQRALALGGQCLTWLGRLQESDVLLRRVIDQSRGANAPSLLPYALAALSELDRWTGRWPQATGNASEAVQWGRELGQVGTTGYALTCLARLDAARGRFDACLEKVREVRSTTQPLGVGSLDHYCEGVLGLAALGAGDVERALDHLTRAHRAAVDLGLTPTIVPYAGDLVGALARAGRLDELAGLAEHLASYDAPALAWPAALAAAARALAATDPDEAEVLYRQAVGGMTELPFERARVHLWWGRTRRRAHRPTEARRVLQEAVATFEALGAEPWQRIAWQELGATGVRSGGEPPRRPGSADLTAQELQVASLVAEGMSNADVAAALFMSHKTVEAHLTRIYRKLRIRSRTDLARLFARGTR